MQTFITRKTHRLLNPLLLITTLTTIGFILYTFGALGTERHELKIAKEDALRPFMRYGKPVRSHIPPTQTKAATFSILGTPMNTRRISTGK